MAFARPPKVARSSYTAAAMEDGGRNAGGRVGDTTGVVVSVHPVWRSGADSARKYVRLRVEYDVGDGPEVGRFEVVDRPGLGVGSVVLVRRRRSGGVQLRFPQPTQPTWWRPPQPASGLAAYAAMIVLILLLAGGTYYVVVYNTKPPIPSPSPSPSVPPAPPSISPAPPPSTGASPTQGR
jgi:hypothetical protein